MPKKQNFLNYFNMRYFLNPVRLLVLLLVVFYIFQIGPKLNSNLNLKGLFNQPLVRIAAILLLLSVSHFDGPLSLLLLLALLVTFVPGFVRSVGSGTQKVVSGTSRGAQTLVGGVAQSGQHLVGELSEGTQQVVGGVAEGTQQLLGSVGRGFQQVLQGASGAVGDVVTGATTAENLVNPGGSCQAVPRSVRGCNPLVGANAGYLKTQKNENCLYDGVKVWKNELGPQGLDQNIMGWSGGEVGASY